MSTQHTFSWCRTNDSLPPRFKAGQTHGMTFLCSRRGTMQEQGERVWVPVTASQASFIFRLPSWTRWGSSVEGKMATILQLSQYCTFRTDSISTVITEPGQPVSQCRPEAPFWGGCMTPSEVSPWSEELKIPFWFEVWGSWRISRVMAQQVVRLK